jgi:hypothetical protein
MVYIHSSVEPLGVPALLFARADLQHLDHQSLAGLAYDYYGAILSLFASNHAPIARGLVQMDSLIFEELRTCLPETDRWIVMTLEDGLRQNSP